VSSPPLVSSPFLNIPPSEWSASNALAFAFLDLHPVSPGHTLVVPRRLIATWFDATPEEQRAIFQLVDEVKRKLDAELKPDGYNIGINAGVASTPQRSKKPSIRILGSNGCSAPGRTTQARARSSSAAPFATPIMPALSC
jgi:diadenosine tetraphosphate (Ap4A) HIT family hydrolase